METFFYDPNLVLYLPLYKKDGASFMSDDAYGHLCTVTGAVWTPRGRVFDGNNDNINCGNSSAFNFGVGDFSVEFWLKHAAGSTTDFITYKFQDDNNRWYIHVDQGNHYLRFWGRNTGGEFTHIIGTTTIDTTDWHHCVLVVDKDLAGGSGWYLDGALEQGMTATNTNYDNTGDLLVGYTTGSIGGTVGVFREYNRILPPLEIQRKYLDTKWRYQ